MHCLQIVAIEDGLGFVLPPELLAQMKLAEGDHLLLEQTSAGWAMQSVGAETSRQVEAGRAFARRYREVLRSLADS